MTGFEHNPQRRLPSFAALCSPMIAPDSRQEHSFRPWPFFGHEAAAEILRVTSRACFNARSEAHEQVAMANATDYMKAWPLFVYGSRGRRTPVTGGCLEPDRHPCGLAAAARRGPAKTKRGSSEWHVGDRGVAIASDSCSGLGSSAGWAPTRVPMNKGRLENWGAEVGKSSVSRVLADYLGVLYEEAERQFKRAQLSLSPLPRMPARGCGWQHRRPCLTCSRSICVAS